MSRTPGAKDKQKRKPRKDGNRPAWSKSPIINDQNAEQPSGYNTRRIRFMNAIAPSAPLDVWDVPEMERRFVRYLEMCDAYDMKVGNLAAYFAIGIDKGVVFDWLRQDPNVRNERTAFIKKVQQICAMYREGLMEDGKINPVTGIFWQKNYDGLKDQQEQVIVPGNPLGDTTDSETLRRRYLEQKEILEIPEASGGAESKILEAAERTAESAEQAQKGAERRTPADLSFSGDPENAAGNEPRNQDI